MVFLLLFIGTLSIYLSTMFPTVAPYRDSGEMVSTIHTLGIAHSPGYPLYILIGKLFTFIVPFGNQAYRLNVFSAIASSLTGAIFYLLSRRIVSLYLPQNRLYQHIIPIFTTIVLVTSYLQWYLALVSEMYTLHILFATIVLYLFIKIIPPTVLVNKNTNPEFNPSIFLFSFLYGLFCANRLDLILILPGLVFIFVLYYISKLNYRTWGLLVKSILFFGLGLTVYLYLPVRSWQNPYLDWNHPATLARLIATITRKTHGGTLDLLSTRYLSGENFIPGIRFFLNHLVDSLTFPGLLLGLLGVIFLVKRNILWGLGFLLCFIISGPVFVYLSNIPPNPHALVILEAHFILPNLVWSVFMVFGLIFIYHLLFPLKYLRWILPGLLILLSGVSFIHQVHNFYRLNKRNNYFAYDYAGNVLRSVASDNILVVREDVQLFSLWHHQMVLGRRKDVFLIAQGLAASPWYQSQIQRKYPDLVLANLREKDSLNGFYHRYSHGKIYFTSDCELLNQPDLSFQLQAYGLGYKLVEKGILSVPEKSESLITNIYVYRDKYQYQAYAEFFTPDLIEEYAKIYYRTGLDYLTRRDTFRAIRNYHTSIYIQPEIPQAYADLGYLYITTKNWPAALQSYQQAEKVNKILLHKADLYNSYPETKDGIRQDLANTLTNLGVIYKEIGQVNRAAACYEEAVFYFPQHKDAKFNLAVLYWDKDWNKVITILRELVAIDPGNERAQHYLSQAMYRTGENKN